MLPETLPDWQFILRSIITHITQEDKRSRFVFSSPWKDLDYKTLNDFVRRIFFVETIQLVLWLFVQANYISIWHSFAPCVYKYIICFAYRTPFKSTKSFVLVYYFFAAIFCNIHWRIELFVIQVIQVSISEHIKFPH